MDLIELVALYRAGGWVPLTAVVGGALVRLMKSDTKLPIDVPKMWRPWLAMAITIVLAAIQHRFAGTGGTWPQAIVFGIFAGCMAVTGHDTLIKGLRDGKEIQIPGLMKGDDK